MRSLRQSSIVLSLLFVCICACKASTQTPTPLTSVDGQQGGKIVYGAVDGATTQPAALAKLLTGVQSKCGEKPQIGRVFRFRGTNSVGVFFTVTDHRKGSKVAGLAIATATGPNQVEAALLTDGVSRFGQTVNPMLKQLLSVWHPGSQSEATGTSAGAQSASADSGHSAPAARLRTVTASDNSASIGIPDGWQLDPRSAGGAMIVRGPNGEQLIWGAIMSAVDPYNPQQVQAVRAGIYRSGGTILYPYHQDLTKAYPDLVQAWRRANNKPPVKLQMDEITPMKEAGNCIHVKGHIDLDGQGMKSLNEVMCMSPLTQWGGYTVLRNTGVMTDAQASQENNTIKAIAQSLNINQQVMNQQMQQKLAQKQANDQAIRQNAQIAVQNIQNIGAQATARYNAQQAANDAQHAGYWAQQQSNAAQHAEWNQGQIDNARNGQGFSNYLLDQTVIQGNDLDGTVVGHATVWNNTADALVKLDPNRFEIVDTPNYWLGTDFHQ
ncbi:MAG: hypothetical protein ABR905_12620 [Terracidiphilus sp.]|jgi:hypothetical protein